MFSLPCTRAKRIIREHGTAYDSVRKTILEIHLEIALKFIRTKYNTRSVCKLEFFVLFLFFFFFVHPNIEKY